MQITSPRRNLAVVPLLLALVLLILPSSGRAAEATATLSPNPQNFGTLTVGQRSSQQQFTFHNNGPEAISISGVAVSGANAADFPLENNGCGGATLASGESCFLYLSFAPTANGLRNAQLEVSHDGEGSPTTAALSGIGLRQHLELSPSPLEFVPTTVGNNSERQLTVTNDGEAPTNVQNVQVEGPGASAFNVNGSNCGFLNVGENCQISLRFQPGASGTQIAVLHVHYEGSPGESVVELSGLGAAPQLRFEPESHDFGLQPIHEGSTQSAMVLRNIGAASVQVGLEVSGGSNAFFIGNSNCYGTTLAPNETCSLQVSFSPNETGLFVGAVRANANGSSFSAEVRGEGGQALISGSPSPLDFGEVATGSTSTVRFVTLTNSGNLPGGFFIVLLSGGDVGSFQLLSEDCTGTLLSPGGSCHAQVRFAPSGPGLQKAQLSFIGNGEGIQQIPLSGIGVSSTGASLTPNEHNFGSQSTGTVGPTQLFILTNEGSGGATMNGATLTGVDPDQFRISRDTCAGATLAHGASCQIGVRFAPDSAGARAAELRVTGTVGTLTASFTGTAIATAVPDAMSVPAAAGKVSFRSGQRPLHPQGSRLPVGELRCRSQQSCQVSVSATVKTPVAMGGRGATIKLPAIRVKLKADATRSLSLRLNEAARRALGGRGGQLQLQLSWQTGGESGRINSAASIRPRARSRG